MGAFKGKNIDSLDCVKGIACFFVVLIHCPFPGAFGEAVRAIARFGVPFFFSVTGYFLLDANGNVSRERIARKCKHIIGIIIPSVGGYLIFRVLCYCIIGGRTLNSAFIESISYGSIVRFIVTNSPLYYPHLWFLYALVYSYALLYIMQPLLKKTGWKKSYVAIALVVFTLMSEILPKYGMPRSFTVFNIGVHNLFLLRAFPFILVGMLLREKHELIQSLDKLNTLKIILMILFCTVLSVVERFCFVDSQFYVGSYGLVVLLTMYCIKNPNSFSKTMGFVGKNLSLYVYVIQYMIIEALNFVVERILPQKYSSVYGWLKPCVCLFGVLLMSFLLMKCKEYYVSRRATLN